MATSGCGCWAISSEMDKDFRTFYLLTSSAYASLAGDVFAFRQPIEADMISDFAWGTASAQPVTLSFLVQCSLSGTFSGVIANAASGPTRSYPFTFSIPTAGLWTKIAVSIPGDTSGSWTLSGNGVGALAPVF